MISTIYFILSTPLKWEGKKKKINTVIHKLLDAEHRLALHRFSTVPYVKAKYFCCC